MKLLLSLFFLVSFSLALQTEYEVENTNIFSKESAKKFDDYNRLRLYLNISEEKYENYDFKLILDNNNSYERESNKNKNKSDIYRAYLKYSGEKQIITLGKQRIPFGVGRIWNPIDIFNPIDATAIESAERKGTSSFRYEYSLDTLTTLDTTLSEKKYSARLKGNIKDTDLAFVVLKDKEKDQIISGYEVSGEFYDTGIELRSEGGYFYNKNTHNGHEEFIFGAQRAFESSLNILTEYKYNSLNSQDYLALNLSYTLSPLINSSYLAIKNLDDKSSINMIRIDYSLSDESELNFGAYVYFGDSSSQYGSLKDSLFVRYFIHF